ncbi:probable glycosyltransferase [Synechococcus sp. BL107]|uniref:glycosyltransferase n=1 Tax=Synechococcus sp. BL107 TaxID=313625 RepID=UPI0000E53C57|nr:glycosyltransferase [Synechococcus sp. BL107]EAU71097.1 probable glycosyltransferase [Synechococcus sp. BL107]
MKILILHPNFPGQFKHLCSFFENKGHDVRFICQTHYGRRIKGIKLIAVKHPMGHEHYIKISKSENKRVSLRADYYRSAFVKLNESGWKPNLVISHTGWGCGVHVKEIWPDTKLIGYFEWWFSPDSELTQVMRSNPYLKSIAKDFQELWKRNIHMAFEMTLADYIVAPSIWQKKQLPDSLIDKCNVIYDGVNENVFRYDPKQISPIPKITYGTRGMEPMRCFPEFIKSLPALIEKWPDLTVEIAGLDQICYGGKSPKNGSWMQWAKNSLSETGISDNIKWVGRLEYDDYVKWLQSSWCHVYLTHPYVMSWSLHEAYLCNTPIVTNKSLAVEELFDDNDNIEFCVDLEGENIIEAINMQLRNPNRWKLSSNKRKGNLSLQTNMKKWENVAEILVAQQA